jgi:type III pantothenate kinase
LTSDSPHGIKIGYRDPRRLGVDRLAAAIGAHARFPKRNVLVVDCGTATTVTALRRDGAILGGAIFPGIELWARALAAHTAQLPEIRLRKPVHALGRTPEEAIASGIWHGHAGALREVIKQISQEAFGKTRALVIGTGGNAENGAVGGLFSILEPNLILYGLAACAKAPGVWDLPKS